MGEAGKLFQLCGEIWRERCAIRQAQGRTRVGAETFFAASECQEKDPITEQLSHTGHYFRFILKKSHIPQEMPIILLQFY